VVAGISINFQRKSNQMIIFYAILGFIGIVALGYWELKVKENKNFGLTTWMFGCAPFIGILIWIANLPALAVSVRILIIVALSIGAWIGLRTLYKKARTSQAPSRK
jgi:hypothetical protein